MRAEDSRWMTVETILRSYINFGTIVIILLTIFSMPKDDEENETVLDQTMNFTALLVLISLDNELAALFDKRIDKLDVVFEHDDSTLKEEFNIAADFYIKRK